MSINTSNLLAIQIAQRLLINLCCFRVRRIIGLSCRVRPYDARQIIGNSFLQFFSIDAIQSVAVVELSSLGDARDHFCVQQPLRALDGRVSRGEICRVSNQNVDKDFSCEYVCVSLSTPNLRTKLKRKD